jgi:hypothetical protein
MYLGLVFFTDMFHKKSTTLIQCTNLLHAPVPTSSHRKFKFTRTTLYVPLYRALTLVYASLTLSSFLILFLLLLDSVHRLIFWRKWCFGRRVYSRLRARKAATLVDSLGTALLSHWSMIFWKPRQGTKSKKEDEVYASRLYVGCLQHFSCTTTLLSLQVTKPEAQVPNNKSVQSVRAHTYRRPTSPSQRKSLVIRAGWFELIGANTLHRRQP